MANQMGNPIRLDLLNFQASAPSWKTLLPNAMLDLFFFKAAYLWGQAEVEFLNSSTDLDDATGWRAVRPLGRGGYGLVGLWQRFDHTDTIIDSIAIKQQAYSEDRTTQQLMQVGFNGLAREAALMHQLNQDGNQNIITLRGFKNNTPERLWRFYFEFAPWGDLRLLKNKYRAWNTYFPEEFLWHLFHGLANAALKMESGPFRDIISNETNDRGQAFVLHLDLKPSNIFLGDAVDEEPSDFSNYPTIKIGDFGLAQLSGPSDRRNPAGYRWCGTTGYRPPEHTGLTAHWNRRPEGESRIDMARYYGVGSEWCQEQEMNDPSPGYQFTSAHNVWVIGKIMWEVMTLREGDLLNQEMAQLREREYWGEMREEAMDEIRTSREPEYSERLREWIRECLRISPPKRPTPQQLYAGTMEPLLELAQEARDEDTGIRTGDRVYYMGNEINDMPIGQRDLSPGRNIPYTWYEFAHDRNAEFLDPDLESLRSARWQPSIFLDDLHGDEPVVQGGRKRRRSGEFYVFGPSKDNPRRVTKRVHLASDFDDDDDDDDDDDSEGQIDRGERRGGEWGGGKFRGGKGGGQGGKGGYQGGMGRGGKGKGIGMGKGLGKRKGLGKGKGGKGPAKGLGKEPGARRSGGTGEGKDGAEDDEDEDGKEESRTDDSRKRRHENVHHDSRNKTWSRKDSLDVAKHRKERERRRSRKDLPSRDVGNSSPSREDTAKCGTQREEQQQPQQQQPQQHHPPHRRADQEVINQNLPTLETRNAGGRQLRPRR